MPVFAGCWHGRRGLLTWFGSGCKPRKQHHDEQGLRLHEAYLHMFGVGFDSNKAEQQAIRKTPAVPLWQHVSVLRLELALPSRWAAKCVTPIELILLYHLKQ